VGFEPYAMLGQSGHLVGESRPIHNRGQDLMAHPTELSRGLGPQLLAAAPRRSIHGANESESHSSELHGSVLVDSPNPEKALEKPTVEIEIGSAGIVFARIR
jgi:hypothetical protein